MKLTRWLVLAGIAVCSGCTYTAGLYRSPYINMRAAQSFAARHPKSPGQVVFLKTYPERSHVVLGTLHAPETEWTAHYTTDDLIDAMRRKAAAIGADAIVDYRFEENPTVHTTSNLHISRKGIHGSVSSIPYKGLHAWGEAIMYVPPDQKALIEAQ